MWNSVNIQIYLFFKEVSSASQRSGDNFRPLLQPSNPPSLTMPTPRTTATHPTQSPSIERSPFTQICTQNATHCTHRAQCTRNIYKKSLGTKKFTGPTMHCNALKCPEMHKKYILYPLEEVPRCRKTISPSAIFRRKLCQSCSKVPKSRGKQRTSFLLPLGLHSHLGKLCNDQRDAI